MRGVALGPVGREEFRLEMGIFGLALGLRLALLIFVFVLMDRDLFDLYGPDARGYDLLARNLLRYGAFTQSPAPPLEPELYRTPVYPAFLAGIYAVLGPKPHAAILLQCVIGAAMAAYVARLGRDLFGRLAGAIAGGIVAVDLLSMSLQIALMSETVFTALLLVSYAAWLRALLNLSQGGSPRAWSLLSGVLYGLAVLCRPIAQWFFVPCVGMVFACLWPHRARAVRASAIFMGSFLLVIAPWTVRNYRATGEWTLSALTEIQLITWAAAIDAEHKGVSYHDHLPRYSEELRRRALERGLTGARALDWQRQVAQEVILSHPWTALKIIGRGALRMIPGVTGVGIFGYSDEGTGAWAALRRGELREAVDRLFSQGVGRVVLLAGQYLVSALIYAAFLFGVRRIFNTSSRCWDVGDTPRHREIAWGLREDLHRRASEERQGQLLLVWLFIPILYFVVISLGPNAYSRLLVPVVPFIALGAGYGASLWLISSRQESARGHASF